MSIPTRDECIAQMEAANRIIAEQIDRAERDQPYDEKLMELAQAKFDTLARMVNLMDGRVA